MTHRFATTPAMAHDLSIIAKNEAFYFRTLTITDSLVVVCEVTDVGLAWLQKNKML